MLGLFSNSAVLLASVFSNGSSITSGQVAYGDGAGKLTSGAGLLYASNALTVGDGTSSAQILANGAAGFARQVVFRTAGSNRWNIIGGNATAEGGSNAGSNFVLQAFDDSGSFIDNPITITRAAGGTILFSRQTWNNYAEATAATPAVLNQASATITGGVTDGYVATLRFTPTYSAASSLTVTRHNYLDIAQPTLSGAGPAAMTDACVFRFNAAAGTHKAVDAGTTKTTPGTVNSWVKVNVNGTINYIPAYTSKTA